MRLLNVGNDRYINIELMTHTEPARKERLVVHFATGGGDVAGPSCRTVLDKREADALRRWLEKSSESV